MCIILCVCYQPCSTTVLLLWGQWVGPEGEHRCSGSVGWVRCGGWGCSKGAEEETPELQPGTHIQSCYCCCCVLPSTRVRLLSDRKQDVVQYCKGKHSDHRLMCFLWNYSCLGSGRRALDGLAEKSSAIAYRLWCWSWAPQWLAGEQGVLIAAGMLLLSCWVSRSIQG